MLEGKKILIGISGSIAAYKIATLTRLFVKAGVQVKVVMTPAAHDFVTPVTLATLSKNPVNTAFVKNNRADYSAGTTWGIFANDEDHGSKNIILLNTYKKRVEYPELKRDVLKEYQEYEPDGVLIEKKATGAPLIYELRAMGIPVQEYTPSKGQDTISRLNSVSDIIASGKVWVPQTRWAEELVDEVAAFPSGEHDDLVDATTLALMRFRAGGFLRLPSDEPEEIEWFRSRSKERYYTV